MALKETLFSPQREKGITVENIAKWLKWFDVGTIFAALVFAGVAPALASTLITASVASIAATEVVEAGIKRRRKNK